MKKTTYKIGMRFGISMVFLSLSCFILLSAVAPAMLKGAVVRAADEYQRAVSAGLAGMLSDGHSPEGALAVLGFSDRYDEPGAKLRLLLTDFSGLVTFDSDGVLDTNGTRLLTPEVRDAIGGGAGFSYSYDGTVFTFRSSAPYKNGAVFLLRESPGLARVYSGQKARLLGIALPLLLLPLFIGGAVTLSIGLRFKGLMAGIAKLKEGKLKSRIRLGGSDEFAMIADELNELSGAYEANEEMRHRFVSDASHELKTPLASIKLLSDSIIQNPGMSASDVREFLTDINTEIGRLSRISEKLLQITKFDDIQPSSGSSLVNLMHVAENVCRMLNPLAHASGTALRAELSDDCVIDGTYDTAYQVFYNIVENAIKYSGKGTEIKIYLFPRDNMAIFITDDEGEGIPSEDLQRIFDRFYRVDRARARATGGTGLGLSIVASAVASLNGSVTAENRPSGGSRFKVSFPLAQEPGFDGSPDEHSPETDPLRPEHPGKDAPEE